MRLLFVARLSPSARSVATIAGYVRTGRALGHEAAVYGAPSKELPELPYSLDVGRFDAALFVVHGVWDFPEMPHLARLLDGMPRARRAVVDCWGRYNETVRVEHDFNHLEKVDGHQGWEWTEALRAVSDTILQPSLRPRRPDVRPFLFHGYEPRGAAPPDGKAQRYGLVYVGNNWQRWTQLRPLLLGAAPLAAELGPSLLAGWDWAAPPAWAKDLGLHGADVEPDLLRRLGVETRPPVRYDAVLPLLGQGRVAPVVHRPLFRALGLVTNRTFETFGGGAVPLVLLPPDEAEAIYGPAVRPLIPGDDRTAHLADVLRHPEPYRQAVHRTRDHLATHHSYEHRWKELLTLLEDGA